MLSIIQNKLIKNYIINFKIFKNSSKIYQLKTIKTNNI
jgi:hypothetical protein